MQVLPPPMSLYETKVLRALDQVDQHNAAPINTLASEIEGYPDDVLIQVLKRLSTEMDRLDSALVTPFVGSLLRIDISTRSLSLKAVYTHFLSLLTSLNPKWWADVAHKIVEDFCHSPSLVQAHHELVKRILKLVPTSQAKFERVLAQHFPHKHDTSERTLNYVKNLLQVLNYEPEMQQAIWGIVIERVMQLDVECDDNEDDDEEDDDDSDEEQDSDEDMDSGSDSDSDNDQEVFTDAQMALLGHSGLKQLHDKLDLVMVFLIEYLDLQFSGEVDESIPLFITLLEKFKEYVVPTHTTRCIQFLMFRVVHAHPDLMDAFLVAMIDMAVDPLLRIERRQKAMQYVSSFIARARGLSRDQLVKVVAFLCQWTQRYILEREHEVDEVANMSRFRMFYATCQALFYMFCFRHKDLLVPGTNQWVAGLDTLFQRAIITKFNPLRYCKNTVTYKFARLAQQYNVCYCFSIIEQNRVGRFRATQAMPVRNGALVWPNHREFAQLESYFPFDPLSLRKTRALVSRDYVQWDDVDTDESDSDSFSDDSE